MAAPVSRAAHNPAEPTHVPPLAHRSAEPSRLLSFVDAAAAGDETAILCAWHDTLLLRGWARDDGITPVEELNITKPLSEGGVFGRRRTPLMLAAMGGHAAAVTLLLKMGADATLRDADGKTAAEHAASGALRQALSGAAPAAERIALNARLVDSAAAGDAGGVEAALAQGAFTAAMHGEPRSFAMGLFPLHFAARAGNSRMLRTLLAHGAHAEVASLWYGERALHLACEHGHSEAVAALLDGGAEVDSTRERRNSRRPCLYGPRATPLCVAASHGHAGCVGELLRRGAAVEAQDGHIKRTPLQLAVCNGHLEAAQLLLAAGARVDEFQVRALRPEKCSAATWERLQAALLQAAPQLGARAAAAAGEPDIGAAASPVAPPVAPPAPDIVDLVTDEEAEDAPAADAAALAAQLAAMTLRAQAAEASLAAATARVAALERDARDAARSMRSTAVHAAAVVGVKRERLEEATAAAASAADAATRAANDLEDAGTCRVCFDAPREMLFAPCLHIFMCQGCSEKLLEGGVEQQTVSARVKGLRAKPPCPVCRKAVQSMSGPVKWS